MHLVSGKPRTPIPGEYRGIRPGLPSHEMKQIPRYAVQFCTSTKLMYNFDDDVVDDDQIP